MAVDNIFHPYIDVHSTANVKNQSEVEIMVARKELIIVTRDMWNHQEISTKILHN